MRGLPRSEGDPFGNHRGQLAAGYGWHPRHAHIPGGKPLSNRGDLPLAGLRIIAIEQFGAGPFATLALADLGAEVIKVEDPGSGGDVGRYVPPGQKGADSLYFETFNRGKRSIVLDIKAPAGRVIFEKLVRTSAVVFNNLRGDLPDELGLTYETLKELDPRIVCVSLSGYGRRGTRRADPGYDALVQAEVGWAAMTGEPDAPPTKTGLSLADYAAGLTAAIAIMAGVFEAQRTGVGRDLDVNLFDVAAWLLTYPATWYLSLRVGMDRLPLSAHPSIVPFQFFAAADGYLAIACAKPRFFEILCEALGTPSLALEERFRDFAARSAHREELTAILSEKLRARKVAEWVALLRGRIPIAPVRSPEDALDDPELQERGLIGVYEHERLGTVRALRTAIDLQAQVAMRPAPALDEDGPEILRSLGYSDDEVRRLGSSGAFGKRTL